MSLEKFRFTSPDARRLCREELKRIMDTDTHDFQLEAITHLLDEKDVLLITATGTGKTNTFIRFMKLVEAFVYNSSLSLLTGRIFPSDPAMIIVCPTKALEMEMVRVYTFAVYPTSPTPLDKSTKEEKMRRAGLTALAINQDTVQAAWVEKRDLYKDVRTGVRMILLSPEQLQSKDYEKLMLDPLFSRRVVAMAVDEVHFLNSWGRTFRKDYEQVGFARARLETDTIPLIAVTATLQVGPPVDRISKLLGFQPNQLHVIRLSNMRHDIQIIFRTMSTGIRSGKHPDLDWVLRERCRTLIFCSEIAVGHNVSTHLLGLLGDDPHRHLRVRKFNAMNWKSYNDETLSLWTHEASPHAQIIIATAVFSVGMDSLLFDDVILFGEPEDANLWWQVIGRLRPRALEESHKLRGICYLPPSSIDEAHRLVAAGDSPQINDVISKSGRRQPMDHAMANIIAASCKVNAVNKVYGNPPLILKCTCDTCRTKPPMITKDICDCSGCLPESVDPISTKAPKISKPSRRKDIKRISKSMRAHGEQELKRWRDLEWDRSDEEKFGMLPSTVLLPDIKIRLLLDMVYSLNTLDDLKPLIADIHYLKSYENSLLKKIQELVQKFEEMRSGGQLEGPGTAIQVRRVRLIVREPEPEEESDIESEEDT